MAKSKFNKTQGNVHSLERRKNRRAVVSPVVAVPRNFNNEHVSWQRFHLVVLVHVRQLPTLKGFICELSNAKNPGRTIPTNPNPRA